MRILYTIGCLAFLLALVGYLIQEVKKVMEDKLDKRLHVIAGVVIYFISYAFFGFTGLPLLIVSLCGLAKELIDKFIRKTRFDLQDLKATFIGGIYGFLLVIGYQLIVEMITLWTGG